MAAPKRGEMIEKKIELYGGEVQIVFKENKETGYHAYFVTDEKNGVANERVKGVTTFLEIKDKSNALVSWATSTAGLHLYDILAAGEIITMADVIEAIGKHRQIKEEAGVIGTAMHAWCEYFIKHKMKKEGYETAPVLPEDKQILLGVNSFLEWYMAEPTEFIESEKIVYSRKHKYIGTLDVKCLRSGRLTAGDFKSSNGIYNSVLAQMSAYANADEEEHQFLGMPITYEGRVVLRLSKETEDEYNTRMDRKNMIKGKEVAEFDPYQPFEWKEFYGRDLHDRDLNGFLLHKGLFEWNAETDFYKNKNK